MRLSLLASGSKGNSLFLETDSCRLLIDAGLSGRETAIRLASIGVDAATLDGILVTHEHTDHIRSVGTLARRLIWCFDDTPTIPWGGHLVTVSDRPFKPKKKS